MNSAPSAPGSLRARRRLSRAPSHRPLRLRWTTGPLSPGRGQRFLTPSSPSPRSHARGRRLYRTRQRRSRHHGRSPSRSMTVRRLAPPGTSTPSARHSRHHGRPIRLALSLPDSASIPQIRRSCAPPPVPLLRKLRRGRHLRERESPMTQARSPLPGVRTASGRRYRHRRAPVALRPRRRSPRRGAPRPHAVPVTGG